MRLLKKAREKFSNDPSYRLTYLAFVSGKQMEQIIDEKLRSQSASKSGLRSSRRQCSTTNDLYQLIYDIKTKIVSKDPRVATFYDLEEAFDSKHHDLLMYWLLKMVSMEESCL